MSRKSKISIDDLDNTTKTSFTNFFDFIKVRSVSWQSFIFWWVGFSGTRLSQWKIFLRVGDIFASNRAWGRVRNGFTLGREVTDKSRKLEVAHRKTYGWASKSWPSLFVFAVRRHSRTKLLKSSEISWDQLSISIPVTPISCPIIFANTIPSWHRSYNVTLNAIHSANLGFRDRKLTVLCSNQRGQQSWYEITREFQIAVVID